MFGSKIGGIVLAAIGCFLSRSQAATIYTDSVFLGPGANPSGSYTVTAWTGTGATGDGGSLTLDVGQSFLLTSDNGSVGIGHNWYGVSANSVVGPDMVANGTLFGGIVGGNYFGNQLQLQDGQNFLLGFWLDANEDSVANPGDRFGWVRLNYTTGSGLTLVDSAISVSDPILAGTLTTVPEASIALIAGVLGGMLFRRHRHNQ